MTYTQVANEEKETEPPAGLQLVSPNLAPARLGSVQDRFPITQAESNFMVTNVAVTGVGTAVGFFGEFLWFSASSVSEGGLGLGLAGTAAVTAFSFTMIASFIATAAITWVMYKDLISDAKSLNKSILAEAKKRENFHETLFFELLRLRCFFNTEDDLAFQNQVDLMLQQEELLQDINKTELIKLVNTSFKNLKNKKYYENTGVKPSVLVETTEHAEQMSFSRILTCPRLSNDKLIRKQIMELVRTNNADFNSTLKKCYNEIPNPPIIKRWKSALWGFSGSVGIGGSILGTGWMVPSYLIGAALLASIPIGGWIALAVIGLVLTVMFGYGVGIFKQKNIQRRELDKNIIERNKSLGNAEKLINQENFQRSGIFEKQIKAQLKKDADDKVAALESELKHSTGRINSLLQAKGVEPAAPVLVSSIALEPSKAVDYSTLPKAGLLHPIPVVLKISPPPDLSPGSATYRA